MKYSIVIIFCLILTFTGVFFLIGNASQDQEIAGKSVVTQGYTKPIIVPKKNLSDEEQRVLQVISKMNQILTEEKDVVSIVNRLTPVCSEMWGENLDLAGIDINFRSDPSSPGRHICEIVIVTAKNKDTIHFHLSGPNFLKENAEKTVMSIYTSFASACIESQTNTEYGGVNYIFHGSGHLGMISYLGEDLAQVGVVKKWDENGKFLGVEALKEPIPFRLFK